MLTLFRYPTTLSTTQYDKQTGGAILGISCTLADFMVFFFFLIKGII